MPSPKPTKSRQTDPSRNSQILGAFFKRIGVRSPNYHRFINRQELQAEPAIAIAWYLYYKTEPWARNPVGLMLGSLADNLDPPAAFLALVRNWPYIMTSDRRMMREMAWKMTSPGVMCQRFTVDYPRMTAQVFAVFLKVRSGAPEELDLLDYLYQNPND